MCGVVCGGGDHGYSSSEFMPSSGSSDFPSMKESTQLGGVATDSEAMGGRGGEWVRGRGLLLDGGFTLCVSAAVETTGWIHAQHVRRSGE